MNAMIKKYITILILLLLCAQMAAAVNDTDIVSIDDLQAQIDTAGAKWTAGNTSASEYRVAGAMIDKQEYVPIRDAPANLTYPATFNWHNVSGADWMTPVRNQGSCGSCWAFGAVGAVEAKINIDNSNPDLDMNLSEQHLVSSCCSAGDCGGGYPTSALTYIKNTGISNESCYPYLASNSNCDPCENWSKYSIEGYVKIRADEDDYKWALQNYGPMMVVLNVPNDWYYYTSGIYEPVTDVGWANHCVVLCGWNDTDGCWIIKNSWGRYWGEEGYARVKYGDIEKYNYGYAILNTSTPAAPELTLSIHDADVAGDNFTTTISVSGDTAISGLISAIQYNTSILELVNMTTDPAVPAAHLWGWDGPMMLFVTTPVTNTNIIDLEFNILQIGSSSIQMDPNLTGVVDANFEFINNVTLESGVVTVHRMGDLTQDGVVDLRDAARCNSILAGITEPTPYDVLVGDLNKNGEIDQADLTSIANMVIAGQS